MAKQDVSSNKYLLDRDRFADLLNVVAYGGERIITAEDIHEISPVLSKVWWEGEKQKSVTNIADGRGRVAGPEGDVRVHIQNQTDDSFIMPVRVMNAEAIDYYDQWKEISKEHGKKKDLRTSAEKLSGFGRKDRLCGVVTIVPYYGRKPWMGVKNLCALFRTSGERRGLLRLAADYPVNLLEVRRFAGLELFRTDLRQVFTFLQKDEDKEALIKYVDENKDFFLDMPEDGFDFLAALSDISYLKKKRNQYIDRKRGRANMCKALEDLAAEKRQEGRREGRQEGRQEGEARLSALGVRMEKDNRTAEFLKALKSRKQRRLLFKEYGL